MLSILDYAIIREWRPVTRSERATAGLDQRTQAPVSESGPAMADPQRHADLASRIEQRRQELGARADVSVRLRQLSGSGHHLPARPSLKQRSPVTALLIAVVALMILLFVAAAAAIAISSGFLVQNTLSSPSTTAENFYAAIHQADYPTAYSDLSTSAQNSLSESKFEATMRATDLISGGVVSYAIVSSTTSGSTATVTVDVVRSGDTSTAAVYVLTMTREQQTWRIATIRQTGETAAPTPSN